MIGISRTLLYSLLTVALMIGGLPAWAGGTMSGHDAPAVSTDSGNPGKSDCHSDDAPGDSAADESAHECCDSGEFCEHDDCRCLCLALTLVVPVRATATAWAAPASPAWASTAPSPTKITSTLLRPPRA
ncbi:CopL family metal-binding regulatory protein [Wenzhouxiangella sp. EGI_FJ10409]|uniref:CopL family metal-binding regulatory protein n=1 Tax=Wenzhouxiangella sp. EGI_FJ10409 TaxID=3243767 RepID=UPI0035DDFC16